MSTTVDQRIVSMEFDNRRFERNVKTSLGTIDKLKKSLKFEESSKSLEQLNKSAGKVDMSKLEKGVESVQVKFSALQVVALTALSNITNSALNAGKRLITSLSTDQLTAGWTKYEEKTSSVQTLMNSTGKSIDEINGYLDHLMWYSDQTSYSFTDMTSSLAQLTSAGGDIEKLIPMIEGIANATAFAGKGTAEFSRVIYNLNQSYSAGRLTALDWKSIEMAGVASKQLKQALIDAGIAAGKISEGEVTIENFRDSLSKGWADTGVMEEAFGKFYEFTDRVKQAVDNGEYATASEAIEALSSDSENLGEKAFKAAQEFKSFNEVITATKDAVSSGWLKTFELFFGNYEEGKKVWTELGNTFYDIFASGADERNSKLREALSKSGWDEFLENGIKDGEEYLYYIKKVARRHGIDIEKIIEEEGSLQNAIKHGKISSSLLMVALNELSDSYSNLSEEELKSLGYTEEQIRKLQEFNEKIQNGSTLLDDLTGEIDKVSGRTLLMEGLSNILTSVATVIQDIKESFSYIFGLDSTGIYNIIKSFNEFTKSLVISEETSDKLKNTFAGLFAILDIVFYLIKSIVKIVYNVAKSFSFLGKGILDVTSGLGMFLTSLRDMLKHSTKVENGLSSIQSVLTGLVNIIIGLGKTIFSIFGKAGSFVIDIIKNIISIVKSLFTTVTDNKVLNGAQNTLTTFVDTFFKFYQTVFSKLLEMVKDALTIFTSIFNSENITSVFKGAATIISTIFSTLFESLSKLLKTLLDIAKNLINFIVDIAKKLYNLLESQIGNVQTIIINLANLIQVIANKIANSIKNILSGIIVIVGDIWTFIKSIFGANTFVDLISNVLNIIKTLLTGLFNFVLDFGKALNISFENIWNFIKSLYEKIKPITVSLIGIFKNLFSSLSTSTGLLSGAFNSIWNFIVKVFNKIKSIIDSLVSKFQNGGEGIKDALTSIFSAGTLATITVLVTKFTIKLISTIRSISRIIEPFRDILTNLGSTLNNFTRLVNVLALKVVAKAIIQLVLSLFILTLIDYSKLTDALAAMSILFLQLGLTFRLVMNTINSINGTVLTGDPKELAARAKTITSLVGSLIAIAKAMLLLAVVVKILSTINIDQMISAIFGLSVTLVVLTYSFKEILRSINNLGDKLGNVDTIKTFKKIFGMLNSLCISLLLLSIPLLVLSRIDWEKSWPSLTAIAGIFGLFALITTSAKNTNSRGVPKTSKLAIKLSALCASLAILASSIVLLTNYGPKTFDEVKYALISFAGALAALLIITIALKLIDEMGNSKKTSTNVKNVIKLCKSLLTLSLILALMTGITKMNSVTDTLFAMGTVLGTLVSIIGILALIKALEIKPNKVKEIEKMLISFSFSLLLIAIPIKMLASLNWSSMLSSFMAMTSTLLVLVGIVALLGLLGTNKGVAKGISAMSKSLLMLSATLLGLSAALYIFIKSLELLTSFDDSKIVDGMNKLGTLLASLLIEMLNVLKELIPEISEIFISLLVTTLDDLRSNTDTIAENIFVIVLALLSKFSEYVPTLAKMLLDIVLKIIYAINDFVPKIVEALMDIMKSIFEAFKNVMTSNTQSLTNFIIAITGIAALLAAFKLIPTTLIADAIKSAVELMKFVAVLIPLGILISILSQIKIDAGEIVELTIAIGLISLLMIALFAISLIGANIKSMLTGILSLTVVLLALIPLALLLNQLNNALASSKLNDAKTYENLAKVLGYITLILLEVVALSVVSGIAAVTLPGVLSSLLVICGLLYLLVGELNILNNAIGDNNFSNETANRYKSLYNVLGLLSLTLLEILAIGIISFAAVFPIVISLIAISNLLPLLLESINEFNCAIEKCNLSDNVLDGYKSIYKILGLLSLTLLEILAIGTISFAAIYPIVISLITIYYLLPLLLECINEFNCVIEKCNLGDNVIDGYKSIYKILGLLSLLMAGIIAIGTININGILPILISLWITIPALKNVVDNLIELNSKLNGVSFNAEKFEDLSKILKVTMDLITFMKMIGYVNVNTFSKVLDSAVQSLESFINRILGINDIDKARDKLQLLKDCIKIAKDIIQTDIDENTLTIRPVIDLSNVRTGLQAMNSMLDNNPYIKTSLNRANSISSDMMEIQNSCNDDLLSTVKSIESKMDDDSGNVYNINGITYSDNDNVQKAVEDLIRAIKIDKRRI